MIADLHFDIASNYVNSAKFHDEAVVFLHKFSQSHHDGPLLLGVCERFQRNLGRTIGIAMLPYYLKADPQPHGGYQWKSDSLEHTKLPIEVGLVAMLSAIVISAWTTFEALAEDLWIAALNTRPNKLSMLRGKSKIKHHDEYQKPSQAARMIALSDIGKFGFDLRRHMGDILAQKFNFSRYEDIECAYDLAFTKKSEVHDGLFTTSLFVAGKLRHVLAHNGGLVDESFKKSAASHQTLKNVVVGDEVPLDGELAKEMIEITTTTGVTLLKRVDEWLKSHPA